MNILKLTSTFVLLLTFAPSVNLLDAQEYSFFEIENEAANATFGWDFFTGDYAGPHMSSLESEGGAISVLPGGFVSSTMNLYAFTTLPVYTFALSNLETSEPFLNVAIQIATTDAAVVETDITPAPNDFQYLGELSSIGGQFPIHYYWLEWNGMEATENFSAQMMGFVQHVSFAGARMSYYNTAEPLDITFGKVEILMGDANCDEEVNLLDIAPFVDIISNGSYLDKADMNEDGVVDLLDVEGFVDALTV